MFSKNTSLPCEYLLTSPATDDDLIKKAILYIKENNISKAVISGLDMDQVRKWKAALPVKKRFFFRPNNELPITNNSSTPMHQKHDFAFGRVGLEMREDFCRAATVVGFEFFA